MPDEKITLYMIFGEDAVRHFNDDFPLSEIEEWGSPQSFEFDTEAEAAAFVKGVDEAVGWMDACTVDAEEWANLQAGHGARGPSDEEVEA